MKIPDQLLPEIYKISKQAYEKKLTLTEGAEKLSQDLNMNYGSARIYILDFKYLLEGKNLQEHLMLIRWTFFLKTLRKIMAAHK